MKINLQLQLPHLPKLHKKVPSTRPRLLTRKSRENTALEAEAGSGKDKKDKKKSQPLKDANGNDLKRPLSAYMLYNNYRRPVLRSEHPGKCLK
jgi:hypothetical protein